MHPSPLPLKLFIQNRHGLKIRVCVYLPIGEKTLHEVLGPNAKVGADLNIPNQSHGDHSQNFSSSLHVHNPTTSKKLVFIMPGLGSHHEKSEFVAIAEIFTRHGYTSVSFDPTHSFGESDGNYSDATFTNYAEDLEDVIEWARNKNLGDKQINSNPLSFYSEPFVLVGHSLGGMSVTQYAEKYPERVKALAPLSTSIAGVLAMETFSQEEIVKWKTRGYRETTESNKLVKRLNWSHMENLLNYNVLNEADKIHIPLLMVVGELDQKTPLRHQELLFNTVSTKVGDKELHVIKNANHDIGIPKTLEELKIILENWVNKIDN